MRYLAFDDLLRASALFGGRAALSAGREGVADRGQRIAQLMRQQRHELVFTLLRDPERILGSAQRLFGAPPFADIARNLGGADHHAVGIVDGRDGEGYRDSATALGNTLGIKVLHPLAPAQLRDDLAFFALQIIRDNERDGLADCLFGCIAENPARGAVPRLDYSVEGLAYDCIVR